jgi:hypothetical protein
MKVSLLKTIAVVPSDAPANKTRTTKQRTIPERNPLGLLAVLEDRSLFLAMLANIGEEILKG